MEIISFEEALHRTEGEKRHLLLGNGFSMALFPDRFSYKSLLDEAQESGLFADYPEISEAFAILQTTDFEVVLQALVQMRKLIQLYVKSPDPAEKMATHVQRLRDALVSAIAGKHPTRPNEITEAQFTSARRFLQNFAGKSLKNKSGCVYTLNYDLLLYWTLMHDPVQIWNGKRYVDPPDELYLASDDGFRAPPDDYDAPYVAWDVESGSNSQNVHFLHGGLHLFDAGSELRKICWERAGGVPLMDQIGTALDANMYPLFVSEGSAESKKTRILHSGYLTRSLKSFIGICGYPANNLFIYGHSLADSDDHILDVIERGHFGSLYVSVFGKPEDNKHIEKRAERLANGRDRFPLKITFFDAASANVWNS